MRKGGGGFRGGGWWMKGRYLGGEGEEKSKRSENLKKSRLYLR